VFHVRMHGKMDMERSTIRRMRSWIWRIVISRDVLHQHKGLHCQRRNEALRSVWSTLHASITLGGLLSTALTRNGKRFNSRTFMRMMLVQQCVTVEMGAALRFGIAFSQAVMARTLGWKQLPRSTKSRIACSAERFQARVLRTTRAEMSRGRRHTP
jgi:hypothetical protein